ARTLSQDRGVRKRPPDFPRKPAARMAAEGFERILREVSGGFGYRSARSFTRHCEWVCCFRVLDYLEFKLHHFTIIPPCVGDEEPEQIKPHAVPPSRQSAIQPLRWQGRRAGASREAGLRGA